MEGVDRERRSHVLGPLHQLTAALYLLASLVAGVGMAVPSSRVARAAVGLLILGVVIHGITFSVLHTADPPPPLTDLPAAVSFMAWIGTIFFLALLRRAHLIHLVGWVAPVAFLGVFFSGLRLTAAGPATFGGSGSWPHAHVLLGSAGISLLGLAALAGLLFLTEHRRLKAKRPLSRRLGLPSLEALDRVNVAALAVGFPLLTLGVITGVLWVETVSGKLWTATAHETWCSIAWAVYLVLVAVRFGSAGQGGRRAAVFAVGGFAFLFFAVIGVGLIG